MKTLQKFSEDYLEQCADMTTENIIKFLDDFRCLHGGQQQHGVSTDRLARKKVPTKLISLKISEDLLNVFKARAAMTSTPYQTQIKKLMMEWVVEK